MSVGANPENKELKCKQDGGLCGVGGYCAKCPHMRRIPGRLGYHIHQDFARGLTVVGMARKYGYSVTEIEAAIRRAWE